MLIKFFSFLKNNLFFLIIFSWIIIPFFAYNFLTRILAVFSLIILTIKHFKKGNINVFFLTLIFIIVTYTVNYFASDSDFKFRHLQLYIFLILAYFCTIVVNLSIEKKKNIILIILVLNLIALVGTYFGLMIDGHASQALSKSSEEAIVLTEAGVGGYGTIYSNVLLFPVLLYLKTKIISSKLKLIIWLNIVIGIVVILNANYLIAILLTFFKFFAFITSKIKGVKKVSLFVFVFFVLILSISRIDYIENFTGDLMEGTSYYFKRKDFFNQINGKQ